jgi:hypothetical protein
MSSLANFALSPVFLQFDYSVGSQSYRGENNTYNRNLEARGSNSTADEIVAFRFFNEIF